MEATDYKPKIVMSVHLSPRAKQKLIEENQMKKMEEMKLV